MKKPVGFTRMPCLLGTNKARSSLPRWEDKIKTKILALSVAIGIISCAVAIGAEPVKDNVLGVTFPERIGKLVFQGRDEYQKPGHGYSLRYQDEHHFKVDVYVYDSNLPDIGDGIHSKRVTEEFAYVINVFSIFERMGKYKDVKYIDKGTTAYPQRSLQFLWYRCQYRESEGESVTYLGLRVSDTYLSAKSGKFIKIRLTLKKEEFTERQAEISGFMKHIAKILGSRQSAGDDEENSTPQP